MKRRRLLALVLCFVMLFSDATSTFASSLSDTPVVITETSGENEEVGSELTETETTGTEVAESEGTEEVVPQEPTTETTETTEAPVVVPEEEPVTQETETVEDTEGLESTTETEESTELLEGEVVVPERVGEGETLAISVDYWNGEESIAIGDGQYATLALAKTAIETFLSENADFSGPINVNLNLDTAFSGSDLALEDDSAWLEVHLNGHVMEMTADAYVRAHIESGESQGTILFNDNYTLTLLPTSQASEGTTFTNLFNVKVVANTENPTGKVIVGECRDSEGALVNRSLQLNDVAIINVNDVVFQGDVGYYYSDGDADTTELIVANEFRVENAYDDDADIHQSVNIQASVWSANVIWNGNGQVTDLKVTDTLTTTAGWGIDVRSSLDVNNIAVTANGNEHDCFRISKATIYDGDNGNEFLSKATVTISGSITADGVMNYPVAIQKKDIVQRTVSDEYGSWIEEEHNDGRAFEVGEVVLALGENATVNTSDIELQQWENNSRMMLKKENNQLIACELAVEVNAHTWNGEAEDWEYVRTKQYDSFGAAVAGIEEDFSDVSGRFDIILYKDVELTEDVTLSHLVREVNIDSAGMWVEVTDDEGNVIDGYDQRVRRTFTFNGHSLTVTGNVYWRESVQILNGADTSGSIMAEEFNWEWIDAAEHFGLADGTAIDRSEETNVVIDGVNIMVPGGRVAFRVGGSDYKYQVNGELLGASAEFGGSAWTILRLVLTEENVEGLFIGEEADVTITDKFSARAGNWAEVRGKLTLAKLIVNPHSQDPYANYNIQIVTGYSGSAWDEEADELLYQGSVIFDGSLIGNGYFASSPIRLEKKEVYRYVAIDEEGNIIWDKEEEQIPCYNEDHLGDLDFASGETVALVNDSNVDASIFAAGGSGAVFAIEGNELKAYKAAVRVDVYWEEDDTGAVRNYRTLEDAFANMEADFGGKPGHYTFSILEDVQMSGNLTVPSFVTSMRMQADWQWIEHRDENNNPIIIYDEEGNEIGREGHDRTDFATLDMNGYTLTSAAPIEFMEGLQIVSTAVDKNGKVVNGKIIVTAEEGEEQYWATVSFNQANDVELVSGELDENGNLVQVERNEDYTWAFISNVDVYVENGRVNLWSNWCNYVIDGDITAELLTLRGNWTVDNVTVTTDLCIESGWYDPEIDMGEPEGFLTVENLTIDGGHVYNGGRIFVNDTFTVTDGGIIDNQALIIADTFAMETGRFDNWGQVDVKNATIQDFYAHTHMDFNEDGTEIIGQRGSIFICDTLTQPANGHSWFDRGTTFVVNEKAVFYNSMIGGYNWDAWDEVNIHRMPNATIEMNGEITCDVGDAHASISILDPVAKAVRFSFVEYFDRDEEGNILGSWYDVAYVDENGEIIKDVPDIWAAKVLAKNEVLFTTNAKEFPTELIWLHQTGENAQYWSVYQKGNELLVGGNWITIYTLVEGNQEELAKFSAWPEAQAFIAELANPDISYIIEISDDLDVEGNLTFPAKAQAVILVGAKPDGSQVELTYTGDITLDTNVTFECIKFNAVNADGEEYHSVVNIKDNVLALFDVNADFASITGTKGSGLVVVGGGIEEQKVTVDGALKNVDIIDMGFGQLVVGAKLDADDAAITGVKDVCLHESVLEAKNGSITITGDTALIGATIKAASKITLGDVYSTNNRNQIVYAGNDAAHILTITGSVYGPGDFGMSEELLVFEGFDGVTADNRIVNYEDETRVESIRCAAIDISVESLEKTGYTPGDVLLVAPKTSPKWFVVGSQYSEDGNRTSIASMTHLDGDNICYGVAPQEAVQLFTWNDTVGSYLGYNSYPTLQDAFDAIETIGNENGDYYIILSEDTDADTAPAVLKTPTKAAIVAIDSEKEAVTLHYKNELQINSMVVLNNVILAPESASSKITLGNNTLYIQSGTKVAEGSKVASITGSGFGKGSVLWLYDTAFTVAGNVDKVDMLCLEDAELNVQGKVNVGDVVAYTDENPDDDYNPQYGYAPTLVGTAVVTRKNNKVTKVASQIKINGEVDYTAGSFAIVLQEKNAAGEYVDINFMADEMIEVRESGIQLAQAPKAAAMMVVLSERNVGAVDTYYVAKANGNLVCLYQDDIAMILLYTQTEYYEEWDEEAQDFVLREENYDILSGCKTFTDAVTEINNLKTKRDYAIILDQASAAATLENPVQLKMPNKNYIETLYIGGDAEGERYDLCYTGNITFTSDVELRNVNFVQVAKDANGKYVSVNTLKDSYPAPVTVSTGGNNLVISGLVTFNTPIKLDGGKKGTLDIKGELTTETNNNNVNVYGSITNFAVVNVEGILTLSEYGTVSRGKTTYTAPVFSATTLNIAGRGFLQLQSDASKATLTVTDLNMSGAPLSIDGNATIKNAVFDGAAKVDVWGKLALTNVTLTGTPTLGGETGFTISGTLTSNTSGATLWSHQDAKGKPVLNITGKVELTDPANKVNVRVYTQNGYPVELNGAPDATGMLLSAKTATADMFVPVSGCVLDGRPAYSEENPDGYFLMKSGTGIYVYYGSEIAVEVLKNGEIFGYYTSLNDASKAITAENDKEAFYGVALLKDVNSADAPAALTLPGNAGGVSITSEGNAKNLYFTGKISLKAPTTFVNVVFQPMAKANQGTAFDIETGIYDLGLEDAMLGAADGMALRNIKGNAKQNTLLFSAGLEVVGNVTNSAYLYIGLPTMIKGDIKVGQLELGDNLTVEGSVTTDKLFTARDVTLDAQKSAVTIKDIKTAYHLTIIYGKNAKGGPNLKITGKANAYGSGNIILNYVFTGMVEEDFRARFGDSAKLELKENQKIAIIEKAPLSEFKVLFNGNEISAGHYLAKANKAVYLYYFDEIVSSGCAELVMTKDGETFTTRFLDFTQAVNEINLLADAEADYTIHVGLRFGGIQDTNQLDTKVFGPFTLPKANTANSLTIVSDNQSEIMYTGNISYSGSLTIKDVTLIPVKAVRNYVDTNITVTKDKRGVAELNLINVSTYADGSWSNGKAEMTGFIGQIAGTKNATDVTLTNCDLRIKKGISNVDTLTLENAQLITCGAATVNNVVITDDLNATASTWDALGKTTVGDITVENWDRTVGYIAAKQDKKQVPTFTVTGDVNIVDGNGAVPVNVIPASAPVTNINHLYIDQVANVGLVVAKAAGADKFIAKPYRGMANILSYKDSKNIVKNGNADEMKVLLSYEGGETYAKSYAEAVTLINNIGDKNGVYTIQFLTAGDVTVNGTSYGALTFPTKAKEVFITGQVDPNNNNAPTTVLKYTGTMKPGVSVTFADIILTEGKVDKDEFVPSYAVTPTVSKADVIIGFEAGATTLKKAGASEAVDLVFTSISGNKGGVAIFDRTVKVQKDASLATLYVSDNAEVDVLGKLTAKVINVVGISSAQCMATVSADGAMNITDINGVNSDDDALILGTRYTAMKKATDVSVSQLTVNGEIDDIIVGIATELYDFETQTYHMMTAEEAEALLIADENATPAKNQKIATMPKANVMDLTIFVRSENDILPYAMTEMSEEYASIVKYNGGVYITKLPPLLEVVGFGPTYEGEEIVDWGMTYVSNFLDWDEAVKEIDKIGNKEVVYEMHLLRNVGQKLNGELAPIKNLKLPTKAIFVGIYGENIFFTGKINIKTDMEFIDTGLMAVKQVKQGKNSWYESTKYDVAIGNNYVLMQDIHSEVEIYNEYGEVIGWYENLPGTISGSKKGYFEFARAFGDDYNYSNMPATKITGIGNVAFYCGEAGEGYEDYYTFMTVPMGMSGVDNLIVTPRVYLESWDGAITVKNLESTESIVYAKNLTVTGTTELKSGTLVAGTDVIGDGTLKLKDVVLHDANSALSAKQDKKGKSLMQITGTVTASEAFYEELGEEASTEGALTVEIRYNNDVSCAQLYNGFMLLTAPKADASWFVPYYTTSVPRQATDNDGNPIFDEETGEPVFIPILDEEGNPMYDGEGNPMYEQEELPGMGWYNPDYCTYKLGKAIYYGYGAQ